MPANWRDTRHPLAVTLQHRHFAFIAHVLKQCDPKGNEGPAVRDQWLATVSAFEFALRSTNPNFDSSRFLTACGDE